MKTITAGLLCSTLLIAPLLYAQQGKPDPFLQWMDRIAQQHLERREKAIAEIHTVAGAERRKQVVRKKFMEFWAACPTSKGPLIQGPTAGTRKGPTPSEK